MRLLVLIGLLYLVYRLLKSRLLKDASSKKAVFKEKVGEIDDVMVKDPYCNVYFAKKDGVHLKINGEDIYFCSRECKDKFLEQNIKK